MKNCLSCIKNFCTSLSSFSARLLFIEKLLSSLSPKSKCPKSSHPIQRAFFYFYLRMIPVPGGADWRMNTYSALSTLTLNSASSRMSGLFPVLTIQRLVFRSCDKYWAIRGLTSQIMTLALLSQDNLSDLMPHCLRHLAKNSTYDKSNWEPKVGCEYIPIA